MNYSVFDLESNGLLDTVSRIHCVSITQYRGNQSRSFSLTNYDEMRAFFLSEPVLVGHNIILYDIPVLEQILGIKITARLIDTLGLAWYLFPQMLKVGLEIFGNIFGVPKPKVVDWNNEPIEVYLHRCEEDVKINVRLFQDQIKYLKEIYSDDGNIDRIMNYITFKLLCARDQEVCRWKVDLEKVEDGLTILYTELEPKIAALSQAMPERIIYKECCKPKKYLTKDGSYSSLGIKWNQLLIDHNLSPDYEGVVKVESGREPGNPGGVDQVKNWLFSLGWQPDVYKAAKNKAGEIKQVPQISKDDNSGEIVDSIQSMYEQHPVLENLGGMSIIKHRIGILEGFLKNASEDGYLKARVNGFTNTMRFKHTELVNLPTIPKPYWELIRRCLIAPSENHLLCGSDMSSLEDNTKQHYMYYFDPDYVTEMRTPGFDPHLDIAKQAGKTSYDEAEFYKWLDKKKDGKVYSYFPPKSDVNPLANAAYEKALTFEELISLPEDEQAKIFKILKPIRLTNKKVNFAGVYGAGPPKLAHTAKITLPEAKALHTTYWERNKAVKLIARNCRVKTLHGQMWLFNPVSKFWYSLRAEKDKFSTLNQSTGVYCFDTWVKYCRKRLQQRGLLMCGQFHDEHITPLPKELKDFVEESLREAIKEVNDELKLNVPLGISIDFGHCYADIH